MRWMVSAAEKAAGAVLNGAVTATPTIASRFKHEKTVVVRNYPALEEFSDVAVDWSQKDRTVVFVGTIDVSRGVLELIEGFRQLPPDLGAELIIAGRRDGLDYDAAIDQAAKGLSVEFPGYLNREQISRLLESATVGAVTSLPCEIANEGISTKMFEYMAAGIPVIVSDMPQWKEVVETASCGQAVDVTDGYQIASAIEYWFQNPEAAKLAGTNGRKAIEDTYNWQHEFAALEDLYGRLSHD
jgi:glycosyltransferase involved in cell wall biosynthesis